MAAPVQGASARQRLKHDAGFSADIDKSHERMLRASVTQYLKSLVPSMVLYFFLALQPFSTDGDHLRRPCVLLALVVMGCGVVMILSLRSEQAELLQRVRLGEDVCLVLRLLMHFICICYDGDPSCVFLKLVSMTMHPLTSAKECTSTASFRIYLLVHNAFVVWRFSSNFMEGLPWITYTLLMDRSLLDWSLTKHSRQVERQELVYAHISLEHLAEVTTKHLFTRFCDATVALDQDLNIAEPTPRLATILGHRGDLKGRQFSSLLDRFDLAPFADHMERVRREIDGDIGEEAAVDHLQARLLDVYGQPVPVHMFHASFRRAGWKPVYLIGISESWRPPRPKSSSRREGRSSKKVEEPLAAGDEGEELMGTSSSLRSGSGNLRDRGTPKRSFSPRPFKRAISADR